MPTSKTDPFAVPKIAQVPQADIMDLVSDVNFEDIVSKTLNVEKGYKKFSKRFGGETKYGISKNRYPDLDIPNLDIEDAKNIYKKDFYEGPGISRIAYPDVAFKVFDFGVTSGPEDSIRLLQKSLNKLGGTLEVDGHLGDVTLTELYKHRPEKINKIFEEGVKQHYKSIRSPKSYQKSWARRAGSK